MVTYGGRFRAPMESYHGVPSGWTKADVIEAHRSLRGTFLLDGQEATEPGAPRWQVDRRNWLQYRATLYRVADGVRAKDGACIELAVRYIELRHIGSYSGFIRSRLARTLKGASLTADQIERLNCVFLSMVLRHDYTQEFSEYVKVWQRIVSPAAMKVLVELAATRKSDKRCVWLRRLTAQSEIESGST